MSWRRGEGGNGLRLERPLRKGLGPGSDQAGLGWGGEFLFPNGPSMSLSIVEALDTRTTSLGKERAAGPCLVVTASDACAGRDLEGVVALGDLDAGQLVLLEKELGGVFTRQRVHLVAA